MDPFLSILSGGAAGALAIWLLRNWISERLKQSIAHEYSQKLESYKAELNCRLQEITHQNQIQQLRTSLFFDHQRSAFSALVAKIAEARQKWIEAEYDSDAGLTGPVPYESYKELQNLYFQHQIFLDGACVAAMELVFMCFQDSFPFADGSGTLHPRDVRAAFDTIEYLQPRVAELFRQKIGVTNGGRAALEIALLGALKLLNSYHFPDIELPAKGSLNLTCSDEPGDAVAKGEANLSELVHKLREFNAYLRRDGAPFHEAEAQVSRYLAILNPADPESQ